MDARLRDEVLELHRFFEDWFSGRLEPGEERLSRFAAVMAQEFEIITPDGARMPRESLIAAIRNAHGVHRDPERPFRIRIDNLRARRVGPGVHLVTYEEWQSTGGRERGRLSTAVFRERRGTPNGLEWAHVHEVWMNEGGDEDGSVG